MLEKIPLISTQLISLKMYTLGLVVLCLENQHIEGLLEWKCTLHHKSSTVPASWYVLGDPGWWYLAGMTDHYKVSTDGGAI